MRTGQQLNPNTVLSIGAQAGSQQDDGISSARILQRPFRFGDATMPPDKCPVNPPVLINPHEDRIVDTAHRTLVRAYVFGAPNFDVNQIDPASVRLNGASPTRPPFYSQKNRDSQLDVTFFFSGRDITLPNPGRTTATLTGVLRDGTPFETQVEVFNRDASFFGPTAIFRQSKKLEMAGWKAEVSRPTPPPAAAPSSTGTGLTARETSTPTSNPATVRIERRVAPMVMGVQYDRTLPAGPAMGRRLVATGVGGGIGTSPGRVAMSPAMSR
jgi:hypothetical protein